MLDFKARDDCNYTCTKCGRVKIAEEFSKDRSNANGLKKWCKECSSKHYFDNKETYSKKSKERYRTRDYNTSNRKRLRKYKLEYIEYKGGVCTVCGKMPHQSAMDFHHIDPDNKKFNIAPCTRPLNKTKEELDKCVLICSNCHRELHAREIEDA